MKVCVFLHSHLSYEDTQKFIKQHCGIVYRKSAGHKFYHSPLFTAILIIRTVEHQMLHKYKQILLDMKNQVTQFNLSSTVVRMCRQWRLMKSMPCYHIDSVEISQNIFSLNLQPIQHIFPWLLSGTFRAISASLRFSHSSQDRRQGNFFLLFEHK